LEEMLFMISHKVRQPVANIVGLAEQLNNHSNSLEELEELIGYVKTSAFSLDIFTRELSKFMSEVRTDSKN